MRDSDQTSLDIEEDLQEELAQALLRFAHNSACDLQYLRERGLEESKELKQTNNSRETSRGGV